MITLPDLWNPGICGRMGNQMLELAAAKSLAIRTGHELVIPECEIGRLIAGPIKMVPKEELPRPTDVYREPFYPYRQLPVPPAKDSVLALHGYFQSYRYFQEHFKQIRSFMWPGMTVYDLAFNRFKDIANQDQRQTIAVCVRRTDYLEKQDYHPVLPISYYREALTHFHGEKLLLVCSDDIPWCREHLTRLLGPGDDIRFVEEHDGWVKLWMMTLVDHHIIANSTYHWWSALLNQSETKTVIAPKLWFGPASGLQNKTYDLIPPTWKRI